MTKEQRKIYNKRYYNKNKNYYKSYSKKYRENNKEYFQLKGKEYRLNKPEYYKKKRKEFKNKNPDYFTNYSKAKRKTDIFYNLKSNIRTRLWYALKSKKWHKDSEFNKYIGCDNSTLKKHIQTKFQKGMSWKNYGKWELDHIIPLSSAKTKKEMYSLCHYTNLQPLWLKDNRIKSNKMLTK